jgi:hypothetical protein
LKRLIRLHFASRAAVVVFKDVNQECFFGGSEKAGGLDAVWESEVADYPDDDGEEAFEEENPKTRR